eukprot:jgi/Botrbrau1/18115/Bobra.0402s0001.1
MQSLLTGKTKSLAYSRVATRAVVLRCLGVDWQAYLPTWVAGWETIVVGFEGLLHWCAVPAGKSVGAKTGCSRHKRTCCCWGFKNVEAHQGFRLSSAHHVETESVGFQHKFDGVHELWL